MHAENIYSFYSQYRNMTIYSHLQQFYSQYRNKKMNDDHQMHDWRLLIKGKPGAGINQPISFMIGW